MVGILVVVGIVAEGVAWWLVAHRRASVWTTVTPVLIVLGASSLLAGPPPFAERVEPAAAVAVGAVVGVALFVGTRVFVRLIGGWSTFQRHSREMYERQGPMSRSRALLLSALLAAPSEELFWRGWVQVELERALDGRIALAAIVALVVFLLANLPSANLSIVAGAVVGGAAWCALAAWAGGVAAALACHALWTGLMIAFPVVEPTTGDAT